MIQEFPEKFARAARWDVLSQVERVEVLRTVIDALSGGSPLKPFGDPYIFLPDIARSLRKLKQEDIAPGVLEEHVNRVGRLYKALSPILEKFFAMKPAARTENMCDDLRGQMLAAGESAGMKEAWLAFLSSLFDRDLTEQAARTKLKNEIKKWFDRAARHLPRQRDLVRVYERYQEELTRRGRYDYEDMIMAAVAQLKSDEELLAYCQEQFQYVLVDEYQDTNSAQNEFLQLLGGFMEQPNIFVVGDDRQSIFRFQGASLENVRFFYDLFKDDITVISLTENYRSQPNILSAAQAVIGRSRELAEKYIPEISRELAAESGRERETVQMRAYASDESERHAVAREVRGLVEKGTPAREIAVLYRFNRDALPLYEAMVAQGVAARMEKEEDALSDEVVRQVIRRLTYLATDGHDVRSGKADELLGDILQYRFWGFSPLSVVKLLHRAGGERRSLLELMDESREFRELATKLAEWRAAALSHPLSRWVDIILKESGMLDWMLDRKDHGATIVKLARVLEELRKLNVANHALTAKEFVRQLNLLREHNVGLPVDTSAFRGSDGRVHLMSAHKAKGLEFEHVFIIHVADRHWGNLPGREKLPLPHGLLRYDVVEEDISEEDERRLFYVAMTRAKQGLHLSYGRQGESGREQLPAIFWYEIPSALKEEKEIEENEEARVQRFVELVQRPLTQASDETLRQWLADLLKNYVMSVTHLNNYLECPRVFYYRNLLHVPQAKTKHQAYG
ncbi:MAG: ATP-dependent helicase, partial [Patescibacteria group bacterium]